MIFKFINISDIFRKQSQVMRCDPNNSFIFYWLPFICGIALSFLFYKDTIAVVGVLTLFISIFIPIFISLLTTMISFVMNKIVTRHNKERIPLIKETFYNICYLIPISLMLLILSLFMHLTIGKCVFVWRDISLHQIMITLFGILFYGGIVHIMFNILMITKRIFKLFDKEIDLLTNFNNNIDTGSNIEEKPKDKNALEGEE